MSKPILAEAEHCQSDWLLHTLRRALPDVGHTLYATAVLLFPPRGFCDVNADDNAQQAELPKPCGKSSVCTAESTETDVLDLPGSAAPVLAANFTGDSILASPTKCLRSLLVTVCSVGPRPTSADTEPVQSDLEKEAHPTILLSLRSLSHAALSCEGRGSASVI